MFGEPKMDTSATTSENKVEQISQEKKVLIEKLYVKVLEARLADIKDSIKNYGEGSLVDYAGNSANPMSSVKEFFSMYEKSTEEEIEKELAE
jgi:hypothetical protein